MTSEFPAIGEGQPLVLLPGMAREPVRDAKKFAALARVTGRRVVVVNRPSGLPRGISMTDLADRQAALIKERFTEPVDLFGCSTGGAIALQLAVDHPELIKRLVIAASASWLGDEGRIKLRRLGEEVAAGRSGARVLAGVLAPKQIQWLVVPVLWLAHWMGDRSVPTDMLATIDAEVGYDVRGSLGEIRAPTLVIGGGKDRAFPAALVEETAAAIGNCRLIIYPQASHIGVMFDRRFGADIAAFLNSAGNANSAAKQRT